MKKKRKIDLRLVEIALRKHFAGHQLHNLVSASRTFPSSARVDLQSALQKLLPERAETRQFGVHRQYDHSTLTFANLMGNTHDPAIIAPMQYEEIDIGETLPARCLRQALWPSRVESAPFALLLSPEARYGQTNGAHLEIAVPPGEAGADLSRRLLKEVEELVKSMASWSASPRAHEKGRIERHGLADQVRLGIADRLRQDHGAAILVHTPDDAVRHHS
jgi:hypothetical protein